MKRILAAVVLFSLNLSVASAADVKISKALFNQSTGEIELAVSVKGECNSQISYRLRGCTDLVVPYTCFIDVNASGGEACNGSSESTETVSLDEFGLHHKKMSYGTVVVQNNKGKSRQFIKLPVLN